MASRKRKRSLKRAAERIAAIEARQLAHAIGLPYADAVSSVRLGGDGRVRFMIDFGGCAGAPSLDAFAQRLGLRAA